MERQCPIPTSFEPISYTNEVFTNITNITCWRFAKKRRSHLRNGGICRTWMVRSRYAGISMANTCVHFLRLSKQAPLFEDVLEFSGLRSRMLTFHRVFYFSTTTFASFSSVFPCRFASNSLAGVRKYLGGSFFLCVHGGISPGRSTLSDINMARVATSSNPCSSPKSHRTASADLLWADPIANFGIICSSPVFLVTSAWR